MTNSNSNAGKPDVLWTHLGEKELEAVTFVRDYVQLVFDNAILTAYAVPSLARDRDVITEDTKGYADALRRLIDEKVVAAKEREDGGLELAFADGSVLRVLPDPSLPEIAMLQVGDGTVWAVW